MNAQTCYRIDAEVIKNKLKYARIYLNMNWLTSRKNKWAYLSIEKKHIGLYYCPACINIDSGRMGMFHQEGPGPYHTDCAYSQDNQRQGGESVTLKCLVNLNMKQYEYIRK